MIKTNICEGLFIPFQAPMVSAHVNLSIHLLCRQSGVLVDVTLFPGVLGI